jgi:hypothetical protein
VLLNANYEAISVFERISHALAGFMRRIVALNVMKMSVCTCLMAAGLVNLNAVQRYEVLEIIFS